MENILNLLFSDRLLDLLSNILSGQPYKPLGAPPTLARSDMVAINRDLNPTQVSKRVQLGRSVTTLEFQINGTDKSPELIALALTTLGSFDFTGIAAILSTFRPILISDFIRARPQ